MRIVGSVDYSNRDDAAYLSEIRQMLAVRPWITLQTDLTREEVLGTLASSRYGIHCMVDEHFGMAVAEMVVPACLDQRRVLMPEDPAYAMRSPDWGQSSSRPGASQLM